MAKRRKRRKWSCDEKRMICAQSVVSDVAVARRYDSDAVNSSRKLFCHRAQLSVVAPGRVCWHIFW